MTKESEKVMSRSTTYIPRAYRAAKVIRLRAATRLNDSENVQLLEALRANQQLLRDLSMRYDRGMSPGATLRKRRVTPTIFTPQDVWNLFGEEMSSLVQEQLRVLLLDTKHHLIRWEMVYQGTVDAITVDAITVDAITVDAITVDAITVRPAELLRPAVLENALAVLLVHNHPPGHPTPSPEDIRTTEHTRDAGDLLSVEVLDHVVLGKNGKYVTIQGLLQRRTRAFAA